MIIFISSCILTLRSLLYTSYPQATTCSTPSRSGFSCSPTCKIFSSEPLTLFSEPGFYTLFPSFLTYLRHSLFQPARSLFGHSFSLLPFLRHTLYVVKGSGRGGQQQQQPDLGEEGDFAVHASVYGKVQAEPNVNPNDQERGKGRERCLLLALAGLSSYLCRLRTLCVHQSVLGVISTPPQHILRSLRISSARIG